MRKSVLIIAIALGFSMSSVNANNSVDSSSNFTITKAIFSVSPFCTSIAKGDLVTVEKLIALGEDVNRKSNGMTPAMYAAKYNRVEILKLLIKNGAELNKKSDRGMTAENYAELSNAQDVLEVISNFEASKRKS
ncbi:hypothetical protein A9Q87_01950 [Flavobacteriales bacterium 34_180_T64]|nr:hypothetical protein A9Q87_01950 [Flavobacteriales bacterium 34_180_T64]